MKRLLLLSLVAVRGPAVRSCAAEDGFRPLFNGKDLAGWVPVNVAPETFTARDGMIVSTGKPTGVLRTDRQYENFVMELEWRHMQPQGQRRAVRLERRAARGGGPVHAVVRGADPRRPG